MKLIAVAIIASILLLELVSLTSGCECGCQPCGPGGVPCKDCPKREQLCKDLIWAVNNLRVKVLQCVCGEPAWAL